MKCPSCLQYSLQHPCNIYATRHKAAEVDLAEAKVVRAEIKSEVKSPNDKSNSTHTADYADEPYVNTLYDDLSSVNMLHVVTYFVS